MSADAERLLRELDENAQISGQRPLERRTADLAIWFYRNMSSISRDNLAGRQAFLEKAFWIMLEQQALMVERIHELENRGKSKNLFLPKGIKYNGKEFQ